ncbi:MAG TPA: ferritin-like domain-containing protein [Allosphingosinicella sp.]|jgi:hypothetical protein
MPIVSAAAQTPRDPSFKQTDIAAVRAIAQAAVDVELFTIPLYMTSLYSIEGYREINDPPAQPVPHGPLYKGRLWPGMDTSALSSGQPPLTANQQAFNTLFSIFIEEMLHLQIAANMASTIGVEPSFTSTALQSPTNGWLCYGPTNTVIPHIVDLADTTTGLIVDIGPLDPERVGLFLAIEQDHEAFVGELSPGRASKYDLQFPLAGWTPQQPLPLFGTIGVMYQFYWDYLNLTYTDGTTLWEAVYANDPLGKGQQDYFNCGKGTQAEYPGVPLHISELLCGTPTLQQMGDMIDAIVDQGEGSLPTNPAPPSPEVLAQYQPDPAALAVNYPSYDSDGNPAPSADAYARTTGDATDHYARFQTIQSLLPQVTTWATAGKSGNWSASDLIDPSQYQGNPYNIPSPDDMANAMNEMYTTTEAPPGPNSATSYFELLSQAVVADIKAVTTTLNLYWASDWDQTSLPSFPTPTMTQSGARMSTVWAVFGKAPDLSLGVPDIAKGTLYHSCQGLELASNGANACAQVEVFHGCIGTNNCQAQGGCGFPHTCNAGGGCGSTSLTISEGVDAVSANTAGRCGVSAMKAGDIAPRACPVGGKAGGESAEAVKCGVSCASAKSDQPEASLKGTCNPFAVVTSAPGDNKCAGFGGCSVPISAYQIYPRTAKDSQGNWEPTGTMTVYDFQQDSTGYHSKIVGQIPFHAGDYVPQIAYDAFSAVITSRGETPSAMQQPSLLRLVFPPST